MALTISAQAAEAWLLAVGLAGRQALAQDNLASAQRMLAIVEARHRAGAALPLDLAQQRGLVAAQGRISEEIAGQLQDSRLALALLLGEAGTMMPAAHLDTLHVPAADAGLPSQLLLRRPDIARAEAQLRAADADIAVARASMLPSLSLQAGAGTGGLRLARLFDTPVYSLAAALAAPIFDNGALAARRTQEEARREELLADYRRAIVAAFTETGRALNATATLERQRAARQDELAQAARALALAETRYRAGAETALTLLDAQRTHFAAQDASLALRTAQLQAAVALFRAAGGGWDKEKNENDARREGNDAG